MDALVRVTDIPIEHILPKFPPAGLLPPRIARDGMTIIDVLVTMLAIQSTGLAVVALVIAETGTRATE